MYECLFFPTYKYQTNNNRYQRQSISSTPHPKQYTVDCLHNISEKCTSIHIPHLYIYSPSQNCLILCVLLFDLLPRVMMWIVGMIPFSPDRRRQYCRRGDFEYSVLLCLSRSRWPRWYRFDGGTAIGMSCTTRLIVVLHFN